MAGIDCHAQVWKLWIGRLMQWKDFSKVLVMDRHHCCHEPMSSGKWTVTGGVTVPDAHSLENRLKLQGNLGLKAGECCFHRSLHNWWQCIIITYLCCGDTLLTKCWEQKQKKHIPQHLTEIVDVGDSNNRPECSILHVILHVKTHGPAVVVLEFKLGVSRDGSGSKVSNHGYITTNHFGVLYNIPTRRWRRTRYDQINAQWPTMTVTTNKVCCALQTLGWFLFYHSYFFSKNAIVSQLVLMVMMLWCHFRLSNSFVQWNACSSTSTMIPLDTKQKAYKISLKRSLC